MPMTALFVRNNDDPANRAVGESALREAIKAAASVDLKVNDVERYDVNIVSGIINVAKERDASRSTNAP